MRWWCGVVAGISVALALAGCGLFSRPRPVEPEAGAMQTGIASWYGPGFHGRPTASGEIYDQYAMTAAHQTLPHGTRLRVTNLTNERAVIVRINDRGPFVDDRIIDLSYTAARQLDMIGPGTVPVRLEVLDRNAAVAVAAPPPPRRRSAPIAMAAPRAEPVRSVAAAAPPPAADPLRSARRFRVQAGTYADYDRARRTQRALDQAVGRAHLALIEAPDSRYYQVRVGPFATPDDAAAAARRIVELGYPALVIAQ
jgi:rare lipoprotein A